MMRKWLLGLALVCTAALAYEINTVGIVCTGQIGGEGSGNFRGSSCLEAQGQNPTISLFANWAASLATETALVFGAKDSAGSPKKTTSISSMWVNTDASTGYAVTRLNSTYNGGTADDVFMRGFGQHGVTLFGVSDADWFGFKTLGVRGQIYTAYGQQVDGTDFYLNSQFRSPDYSKGIVLGYEGSTNNGAIHCASSPCGFSYWVHNGAYRFKAFSVDQNGKLGFVGNLTTYNGGAPQYINITINGEEYQLIAYKKP